MKTLHLAALSAAALILAGCASATADEPEPTPTSTAEETAAAEESSVNEWASVIARAQQDLDDTLDTLEDEQCTAVLAASPDGLMCRVRMLSATYSVSTIDLQLQGPTNTQATSFIAAEPPAEIAGMWEETSAAATAASEAGTAWSDAGCSSEVTDVCLDLGVDFERAMGSLRSEFAGWAPYL